MHALQVIPLLAWFVMRRRRLSSRQQTQLVWLGASVYLGLTLLVTWQALRAQPIIAPDLMTMSVFAALLGLAALGAWLIASARRA
jgi:FtsH-binding integral membrane protein